MPNEPLPDDLIDTNVRIDYGKLRHADLCLEPLVARYPDLQHGYLIEIEYLKRSAAAGERDIRAAVRTATGQLQRYVADERSARQYPSVRFLGVVIVFHGWEMVYCDAVLR